MARPRMHAGEVVRIGLTCPEELASLARDLVDGIYYTSLNQVICLALKKFVEEKSSSPLSPTPPIPSSSITPPIISPKGDIYTPPRKKKRVTPNYTEEYNAWYKLCPKKVGKKDAFEEYKLVMAEGGVTYDELCDAIKRYDMQFTHFQKKDKEQRRFILQPVNWLKKRRWEDVEEYPEPPPNTTWVEQAPEKELFLVEDFQKKHPPLPRRISEGLFQRLGSYDFKNFIEPARFIEESENIIVIACPDGSHAEWVSSQMLGDIRCEYPLGTEFKVMVMDQVKT